MKSCLTNSRLREILASVLLIASLLSVTTVEAEPEDDASGLFYEALAPYGKWVDHQTYGTVWYPTGVSSDWRPYSDGYWDYTEDYGWLWVSDWEWGWAPFHYGRWVWDDWYGWLWIPGRIWAPAWVFWRYGGGYVSWAPLPPQFIWNPYVVVYNTYYINYERYLRRNCWVSVRDNDFPRRGQTRRILPPDQNPLIIKKTRPYGTVALVNNSAVNLGIPVKRIEKAMGRHLQPVKTQIMTTLPADWQEKKGKQRQEALIYRPVQVRSVPDEIVREERNAKRMTEKNPLFDMNVDDRFLHGSNSEQPEKPGRLMDKPTHESVVQSVEPEVSEKNQTEPKRLGSNHHLQEKMLQRQLLDLEEQRRAEEQLMRQEANDRHQQIKRHGQEFQSPRYLERRDWEEETNLEHLNRNRLQEMQWQRQQEAEQRRLQQEAEQEQQRQIQVQKMQLQRQQETEQRRLQQEAEWEQQRQIQVRETQLQRQQEAEQWRRQQEVIQLQEMRRQQEWQRQQQIEQQESLRQQQYQQQESPMRNQEFGDGGISGHRGHRQR